MIEENTTSASEAMENGESCCTDTSCCPPQAPIKRVTPKIGRNDPCPCDSGSKFKKCCGR